MTKSRHVLGALGRFVVALCVASPRRMAETLAVMFGLGFMEGVGLLLLVPLLQLVGVDTQEGVLGGIVLRFRAAFAAIGLRPTLPIVLGLYVAIVALQSALQRREATLSAALQYDLVDSLRTRVYRAVANTRWMYFARRRSSDFTNILTSEVDRVAGAAYYLIELSVGVVIAAAYVLLALRVSPAMTSLVILCGGVLAVAVRGRIDRAHRSGERYSAIAARLHAAVSDHLGSMKMARSYGAEARHANLFAGLSREFAGLRIAAVRNQAQMRQWLAVGSALLLAVIVYVAYGFLGISAASLLLLLFLFARLVPRLTGLYEKTQALATELPAFDAVLEVERQCLAESQPPVEAHRAIALNHRIDLDRVTFTYRDDDEAMPAVQRVSLTVPARATTAIVGPSGGGKSTIADLLMGLLEPTEGQLLVDGSPIGPDQFQSWREQIGYVSQDTFLFHDTVRANLLWAKPEADEDHLWRALAMAAADDFVRELPRGLDTVVGDRGVLVSGGERQRLALARALLREPKLLILDEATSALDSENERRIQQAIERLHEQVTIVIITHRLSMVRRSDLIHVVERGAIVESGTWEALNAGRQGRFRELCQAQGIESASSLVTHAAGGL